MIPESTASAIDACTSICRCVSFPDFSIKTVLTIRFHFIEVRISRTENCDVQADFAEVIKHPDILFLCDLSTVSSVF